MSFRNEYFRIQYGANPVSWVSVCFQGNPGVRYYWVDLACFGGVLKLVVWFAPWMTVGCEPVIQLQETSDLLL
jgi:hypothetical protein